MGAILGALACAVLSGCAAAIPTGPPPADPPGEFVALTSPIVLVGDTQEHESTGFPIPDDDSGIDSFVEVAQRPPEASLFSRRILERVIEKHPTEPILHMGDVLDMSCRSELRRIRRLFEAAPGPLAVMAGNHDGLLFGMFNYDAVDVLASDGGRRWNMGCRTPMREGVATLAQARGQAVTKRDFIAAYLELLSTRALGSADVLHPPGGARARVSWRSSVPGAFVEAIEARLADGRLYSSSFLAQRLALPAAAGAGRRVKLVALDTNQVFTFVGALDAIRRTSPGDIGSVSDDQVEAVTPWVEESIAAGDIVVFAGHHNWDRLEPLSRLRLSALMGRLDHPLVYLSAHTHQGFWAMHGLVGRPLLELNVSSLSDWPIAYRRVTFHFDAGANRIKVVADLLPSAGAAPRSDTDLLLAWTMDSCGSAGVASASVAGEELASVRAQKASRGSLWEWLAVHFPESCESCMRLLYDHAHGYQDQLLAAIEQMRSDVGDADAGFGSVSLPGYCGAGGVASCAAALRARTAANLDEHIRNFRDKARLVDRVNEHLDGLAIERAKRYMVCRAVVGAKADFDETEEASTPGRSEDVRRSRDFFRGEATVGVR